jgi:hypothetical protein
MAVTTVHLNPIHARTVLAKAGALKAQGIGRLVLLKVQQDPSLHDERMRALDQGWVYTNRYSR